jgi:hypothetical protein
MVISETKLMNLTPEVVNNCMLGSSGFELFKVAPNIGLINVSVVVEFVVEFILGMYSGRGGTRHQSRFKVMASLRPLFGPESGCALHVGRMSNLAKSLTEHVFFRP